LRRTFQPINSSTNQPINFLNYKQTLAYLYERLPVFHRIGAAAMKKDLVNTTKLCHHLGNPEKKLKCIHVAGTNGKGSVSHMLAAIFSKCGYKTGLYTSPHLLDFRERIKIDGQWISQEEVVSFVERNRSFIEEVEPSFFELTVGMALEHFVRHQTDINIIETGLGGRLDSTNVILPELSIITNIGHDHQDILGDSLEMIAMEKAGIIKPGIPVVIGETQQELSQIFKETAMGNGANLVFADQSKTINAHEYLSDLDADYQTRNRQTVLVACELLQESFNLPDAGIREALWHIKDLTGFAGRWQKLSETPLVICDTGHNMEGIETSMKELLRYNNKKKHLVWGMVKDKDSSKILPLLPKNAQYYFCQPDLPRAKDAGELKAEAENFGLFGNAYPTVVAAFDAAMAKSQPDDLILVGGSTFVVADLLTYLLPK
jgi:dihydrofolate synthase/folylpolyglutamate synthase